MQANLVSRNGNELTIQFKISLESTMLKSEENIQHALNDAGLLATELALSSFDTNGDPVSVNNVKYTTKGQIEKNYQTPYGEVTIARHIYQSSQGGKTYCPLENGAKIIVFSTPKFAKMVSSKYSSDGGRFVQKDLEENHGRYISRNYIKDISDAVGKIVQAKQDQWSYLPPVSPENVSTVGIGLDGTCMLMVEDGWRQAMVGTISFFDVEANRLDTIYLSAAPEYGKKKFTTQFEKEICDIKKLYPNADYVGIADGAVDNWIFLSEHTQWSILDFFHASGYITQVADTVFADKEKRKKWLTDSCHKLKHEKGGATHLLNEFIGFRSKKLSDAKREKLENAITYFKNQKSKMNYWEYRNKKFPIGSGVTESACKVIVKQRLCNSGMKWKHKGAESVLCLRTLNYSSNRWKKMWEKISRYGP